MARWFIQDLDESDPNREMAHVTSLLPSMNTYEDSTHQQNPAEHPQKAVIGASGGYAPQYWHYCTALFRWKDIDPTKLDNELGKEPTQINKTKRFGDMGGYYMPSSGFKDLGFVESPNNVFSKYRFSIENCVPYPDYGSRGGLHGIKADPFSPASRIGQTCGWIPNGGSSNSWRPSAADRQKMIAQIESKLNMQGSSFDALKNKTSQQWNAAIVAWFHAGYQRKQTASDGTVIQKYKGAKNRAVSACDVYFFGYLY